MADPLADLRPLHDWLMENIEEIRRVDPDGLRAYRKVLGELLRLNIRRREAAGKPILQEDRELYALVKRIMADLEAN